MRWFRHSDPDFETAFAAFVDERRDTPEEVDSAVRDVLAAVRAEGIEAVLRYSRAFDKAELTETTLRVTQDEIDAGAAAVKPTGSGDGGYLLSLWKEAPPASLNLVPIWDF